MSVSFLGFTLENKVPFVMGFADTSGFSETSASSILRRCSGLGQLSAHRRFSSTRRHVPPELREMRFSLLPFSSSLSDVIKMRVCKQKQPETRRNSNKLSSHIHAPIFFQNRSNALTKNCKFLIDIPINGVSSIDGMRKVFGNQKGVSLYGDLMMSLNGSHVRLIDR
uniref:R1B-12_1 protein n=1 Tax=Fopius arisanus TaxID=64838 RepID=A0A0C9QXM4_9HYME